LEECEECEIEKGCEEEREKEDEYDVDDDKGKGAKCAESEEKGKKFC